MTDQKDPIALHVEATDRQLKPLIEKIADADGKLHSARRWHQDTSITWLAQEVLAGNDDIFGNQIIEECSRQPVNKDVASRALSAAEGEALGKLSAFLRSRPKATLWGVISGGNDERDTAFLNALTTFTTVHLADVEKIGNQRQAALNELHQQQIIRLNVAAVFLRGVLRAVQDGSQVQLLEALKTSLAATITPQDRFKLLTAPGSDGRSVLSMMRDLSGEVRNEARFLNDVMATFGDEHLALRAYQHLADQTSNETTRERFRAYRQVFAGNMIPSGTDEIVNVASVAYAKRSRNGSVSLFGTGGKQLSHSELRDESGRAVFETIASHPDFVAVNGSLVFNPAMLHAVSTYNDTLRLLNGGGREIFREPVASADMQKLSDRLRAHPDFIGMQGGYFVNLRSVPMVVHTSHGLGFRNGRGEVLGGNVTYGAEDTATVTAAFAAHPDFIRVDADTIISRHGWAGVTLDDKLRIHSANGDEVRAWSLPEAQSRAVLDALTAKPSMVAISPGRFINAHACAAAAYHDNGLFATYNAQGRKAFEWNNFSRVDARAAFEKLAINPAITAISDDRVVNANSWAKLTLSHGKTLEMQGATSRSDLSWPLQETRERVAFDKLKAGPNLLRAVNDDRLVNLASWAVIRRQKDSLHLFPAHGNGSFYPVTAEQGTAFTDALRRYGQHQAARSAHLHQEKTAQTGTSSAQTTDQNSAGDDIATAVLATAFVAALLDAGHAHAHEAPTLDDLFRNGGDGEYGGGGASGDFGQAAAQADGHGSGHVAADVSHSGGGDVGGGATFSGGTDCSADPLADPLFADVLTGPAGRGRLRGQAFEVR